MSCRWLRPGGNKQTAAELFNQQHVCTAAPPAQGQWFLPRVPDDHQLDVKLACELFDHADGLADFKMGSDV